MIKRTILALLLGLIVGVGLWAVREPNSRTMMLQMWNATTSLLGQIDFDIDADSILAPISAAFRSFADSVSRLWAPTSIQIEVPEL